VPPADVLRNSGRNLDRQEHTLRDASGHVWKTDVRPVCLNFFGVQNDDWSRLVKTESKTEKAKMEFALSAVARILYDRISTVILRLRLLRTKWKQIKTYLKRSKMCKFITRLESDIICGERCGKPWYRWRSARLRTSTVPV
jgi:hypothetical protein